MITVSADTTAVLAGSSFVQRIRVESWYGGQLLDPDIPITAGAEDLDRSLRIPERITLSVPRLYRGVSYAPANVVDPLAANGQQLRVLYGVTGRGGHVEWVPRGWFVLQDAIPSVDSVEVTGQGLLTLIDEAQLISPFQPTGTIGSTLRRLLEPAITVDLTAAPTDRAVPASLVIDQDRLQGVYSVLDAWAADGYVNERGVFTVIPAGQASEVDVVITNATTAVRVAGTSTRDGAANAVVVRGTTSDGGQIQAVTYETTGPRPYGGPFNQLPVPYIFASPLMATVAQCAAAAATVLERRRRAAGATLQVEAVPDPRLQLGDIARIQSDEYGLVDGPIEQLRLPYLPDGGPMALGVRSLA
jgi:hypothetical protein